LYLYLSIKYKYATLEVSGAVRPLYGSLGVKGLSCCWQWLMSWFGFYPLREWQATSRAKMMSFNSYTSDYVVDRRRSGISDKRSDATDYSFIRSSSTLTVLSSPLVSLFQSWGSSVYKLNYAFDQWGMGLDFWQEQRFCS